MFNFEHVTRNSGLKHPIIGFHEPVNHNALPATARYAILFEHLEINMIGSSTQSVRKQHTNTL